jgi:hypothetical protein
LQATPASGSQLRCLRLWRPRSRRWSGGDPSSERGSVAQKQATLGQYDSPSLVVSIWPAAGTSNRKRALDRERGRRRYARLPDARQTRAATYGHLRTLSRVAAAEASLMCHPGHK